MLVYDLGYQKLSYAHIVFRCLSGLAQDANPLDGDKDNLITDAMMAELEADLYGLQVKVNFLLYSKLYWKCSMM